MEQFTTIAELRSWVTASRRAGLRLGLVPTMGALHAGHASLVEAALARCDRVVTSIFVNPTQFGPHEDFSRYPCPLEADRELLSGLGCHALFLPRAEEIYPAGHRSVIQVTGLEYELCGATRPGHFAGVATVVAILLNLAQPDAAFFGRKDYQQFQLLCRMVEDLRLPVELVGLPTVREPDGLALSSRNRYLDPEQRTRALLLHQALLHGRRLVEQGERDPERIAAAGREILTAGGITRIDYVAVRHPATLEPLKIIDDAAIMLIAAVVGSTRLIDNLELESST